MERRSVLSRGKGCHRRTGMCQFLPGISSRRQDLEVPLPRGCHPCRPFGPDRLCSDHSGSLHTVWSGCRLLRSRGPSRTRSLCSTNRRHTPYPVNRHPPNPHARSKSLLSLRSTSLQHTGQLFAHRHPLESTLRDTHTSAGTALSLTTLRRSSAIRHTLRPLCRSKRLCKCRRHMSPTDTGPRTRTGLGKY